jgi:hypothetical protein
MSSQLRQFMPRVVHSGTTSALCSIPAPIHSMQSRAMPAHRDAAAIRAVALRLDMSSLKFYIIK